MGWYDIDSYQNASDALLDIGRSRPANVEIILVGLDMRHCFFFLAWLHSGAHGSFCTSHVQVCSAIRHLDPPDFHTNYFHAANLIDFWIGAALGYHLFDVYFP